MMRMLPNSWGAAREAFRFARGRRRPQVVRPRSGGETVEQGVHPVSVPLPLGVLGDAPEVDVRDDAHLDCPTRPLCPLVELCLIVVDLDVHDDEGAAPAGGGEGRVVEAGSVPKPHGPREVARLLAERADERIELWLPTHGSLLFRGGLLVPDISVADFAALVLEKVGIGHPPLDLGSWWNCLVCCVANREHF